MSLPYVISNKKIKQFIIVFSLFIFVSFSSFLYPTKKAEAAVWGLALPAGITLGGGAYALGALAVGSVAVGLGIEYGDEIKKHANDVWESSTDLAKSSVEFGLNTAYESGEAIANLGSDFWDWTTNKVNQIVGLANLTAHGLKNLETTPKQDSTVPIDGEEVVVSTAYPEAVRNFYENSASSTYTRFTFPEGNQYLFSVALEKGLSMYYQFEIYADKEKVRLIAKARHATLYSALSGSTVDLPFEMVKIRTGNAYPENTDRYIYLSDIGKTYEQVWQQIRGVKTVEDLLGLAGTLGLDNVSIGSASSFEAYNQMTNRVKTQDIPTMKDAGLVVPTNDVVASPVAEPDVTLQYDSETGVYTRPDGTVYQGDVTYTYPNVQVVTGEDGLPYTVVETPTGYVDIKTGNPVVPKGSTGEGDGGGSGTTTKLNLTPLTVALGSIKDKFPFSIPWDVFRLFSVLNVEPKTPVFEIDTNKSIELGGISIPIDYEFNIDFSIFDPIAKVARWGLVLVFDICIVLALRRLTPD